MSAHRRFGMFAVGLHMVVKLNEAKKINWSRFHEALRLTKNGLSDYCIQQMHCVSQKVQL